MEIATDRSVRNEFRQRTGFCGFDLAFIRAEFRLDVGESERRIDFFFRARRETFFPFPQAVFVQLQTALPGQRPQCDVVFLRAGEVLEHRAVGIAFDDSHVGVHAVLEAHGGHCRTMLDCLDDTREFHEAFHDGFRILGDDDEVEVANCFLATPHGTGHDRLAHTRNVPEIHFDASGQRQDVAQHLPVAGCFQKRESLRDFFRHRFADDLCELAGLGRFAQIGKVFHADLFMQPERCFWPDMLDARQVANVDRGSLTQCREFFEGAGFKHLRDVSRNAWSNTRNFAQPLFAFLFVKIGDALSERGDLFRSSCVRARLELNPLQLIELPGLFDRIGDLLVRQAFHR